MAPGQHYTGYYRDIVLPILPILPIDYVADLAGDLSSVVMIFVVRIC